MPTFSPSGPVLVVDDDAAVRHSLKFALELEGFGVRLYEDAAAMLADTDLPTTGCLVIDHYMPAMSGIDLIQRLRQRRVGLPAILITGKATDALRRSATRAGVRTILEKPLEDGSLVESIRGALATCA